MRDVPAGAAVSKGILRRRSPRWRTAPSSGPCRHAVQCGATPGTCRDINAYPCECGRKGCARLGAPNLGDAQGRVLQVLRELLDLALGGGV